MGVGVAGEVSDVITVNVQNVVFSGVAMVGGKSSKVNARLGLALSERERRLGFYRFIEGLRVLVACGWPAVVRSNELGCLLLATNVCAGPIWKARSNRGAGGWLR